MSQQLVDAYYVIKDRLWHTQNCGIPSRDCTCGVDAFRECIATLQQELADEHPSRLSNNNKFS